MRLEINRRTFLVGAPALALLPNAMTSLARAASDTLIVALFPEPSTLNSVVQNWFPNQIVTANIFDGLLEYGEAHAPQPSVAESWSVSEDGLTIQFNLRSGVKWHDGTPFTAADVKFSILEAWKKYHSRGRLTFAPVQDVETPDDRTAILKLSKPSPVLLDSLSGAESPLLPRHLFEGKDFLTHPNNLNPIGTGPFRFKSWDKGSLIALERNEDYWKPDYPRVRKAIYRFIPDEASRAAALEAEEVHYAIYDPVAYSDIARIKEIPFLTVETRGFDWIAQLRLLEFNLRNKYLSDKRVRHAIAHAIDRQGVVDTVVFGYGKPATSPVPSVAKYYSDAVAKYPYDPARAEQLLDEAGFHKNSDGVRFTLRVDREAISVPILVSEYVRQDLKRVGIEVEVMGRDNASFLKAVYTDYDFDINNINISVYQEPQIGLLRLYWSKIAQKGVSYVNASGYHSAEVDEIIEKLQSEIHPEKRTAFFQRFQEIVVDDLPILPLFEVQHFSIINRAVAGLPIVADGYTQGVKALGLANS